MKIGKNSKQSESKEKQFKRGVESAAKILSVFSQYKALASTPTSMLDLARRLESIFFLTRTAVDGAYVLEFCLFFLALYGFSKY